MAKGASLALVDSHWTPTPTETIPESARPSRISLCAIREIVCAALAVSDHQVLTRSNDARIEFARGTVAWLAYANGFDSPEIAAELHREIPTVRVMIAWFDRYVDANPMVADRIIGLAALIDKAIGCGP